MTVKIALPDAWSNIAFKTVSSTMEKAQEYICNKPAGQKNELGIRITAEHQSKGRGRNPQSNWVDDAGKNVLCTYIIPCTQDISDLLAYSPRTALAVVHCITRFVSAPVQFKWPNDVYCSGKKIAGILLETYRHHLLVGIGINVNQKTFSLPATSIAKERGKTHRLEAVYNVLSEELKKAYTNPHWQKDAEEHLLGNGRAVELHAHNTTVVSGILRGLSPQGFILIEEKNGNMHTIQQGTLSFL